jgi:lipopolysaccharide export system permease protein
MGRSVGMTLFGRYIFRQAFGALVMILVSLTAVVWIAMALKQLSVMTNDGQGSMTFMLLTLLVLPDVLTIIAPIALLIAVLHTLNRMNGDSELIVLTAAGATVWRVAQPLMVLAALVSSWLLLSNFLITPWSLGALNDVANKIRTDLIAQVLQPGQFASPEEGLTFHIRERDRDGHLLGLILSDTRSKTESMTYLANNGEITKRGDRNYLILRDGQIVRRAPKEAASIIEFESYVLDLSTITEAGRGAEGPKPHARYLFDLLYPDEKDPYFVANPGSYRSELHQRFVDLVYPFMIVALVVGFLGQAQTTRQGRSQAQVTAFSLAATLKLGGVAAQNMFASQASAGFLVYGLPLFGFLVAGLSIWAPQLLAPIGRQIEINNRFIANQFARLPLPRMLRARSAS